MKLRSKTDSDECTDLRLGTIVSNRRTEIERQFLRDPYRVDQRPRKYRALASRVVSRKTKDGQIPIRAEDVGEFPDLVGCHRCPLPPLVRREGERILGEGRECQGEGERDGKK